MRMRTRVLLCWLAVAASLVIFGSPVHSQGVPAALDTTHYWTYKLLQPPYLPAQVRVQDQFLVNPTPVLLDTLARLVNWVYKYGDAGSQPTVRDTTVHFTWWNIADKRPVYRQATISNQFGRYQIYIDRLEFLLAPAWKNMDVFPGFPYASHYLCYRARGFPSPGKTYFLRDEWRNDVQYPLSLEYLCLPCWKEHNGQIYPPTDTVTHLALYPITPQSDHFYPFVRDQFRAGNVFVQQSPYEYLLVPSTKTDVVVETKRSSWGKVKVLYR